MQTWLGEEEEKESKQPRATLQLGNVLFFFLQQLVCFHNHLHENTYYVVHLDHDSDHVPFGE